ncbi:MAG TPA: DinB family protein [Longimicrobiales bacterium]|nr:DinB family protein [Longimicrobiales bacterium]
MKIIEALDTTRDETLRYFQLGDRELTASYGPGKWPVRFILHHLADADTVLLERIRRILSEGRRVLWAFDQDAWAQGLDYAAMPLDLSRDLYSSARAGIRYLAGVHYETSGHLEWIHSETGLRTLKDEFDKVAEHNAHHLRQIRAALARPS